MLISMVAWGSWANAQKFDRTLRFELFYWDYVWAMLACALLAALTLGRLHPADADSFLNNLRTARAAKFGDALLGGVVFDAGNILLVAAIALGGMAVAFPIGAGLALVIGATLNYIIHPAGNPWLLFLGMALVCLAILFDAAAYRSRHRGEGGGALAIVLSVGCG